ncbi:SUMO-conjugating enzyme UBC9-B [Dermatophagoides farinae]|uniref:SUMO-conjugating enzyme UBC9 n=1 Tax=Dermatophagoides farinae TaxID=6954 RepID=A0A9D4SED0_DERFA|nr:SUMO-conjugating enzyme UBC9-B-like [Dermatophagoides farinae]KAH7638588.1 hypothetical protein HUG17_2621 [Dermatophagoides farinae]
MDQLAMTRLSEERKSWRKDHPYGFEAKPVKNPDGSLNLMIWNCSIPGKPDTPWENGKFKLKIKFNTGYPLKPPVCQFDPPIFHPNIWLDGQVCLSILNPENGWRPSTTIREILIGIQDLLNEPNIYDPANLLAYEVYVKNKQNYIEQIIEQAKKFIATD